MAHQPKIMGGLVFALIIFLLVYTNQTKNAGFDSRSQNNERLIINLKGSPHDVVWIVQFSDLHFSVHHPERALDFQNLVGPTLAMINPSLVFITGDLTGYFALLSLFKKHKPDVGFWFRIFAICLLMKGLGLLCCMVIVCKLV